MSTAVKKCPQYVYRPGVGIVQLQCCVVIVNTIFDGGSPWASGSKIIDGNGSELIIDGGKP